MHRLVFNLNFIQKVKRHVKQIKQNSSFSLKLTNVTEIDILSNGSHLEWKGTLSDILVDGGDLKTFIGKVGLI
jgi:hypothetical protein